MNPASSEVLSTNQTIILIGDVEKMDKFKESYHSPVIVIAYNIYYV